MIENIATFGLPGSTIAISRCATYPDLMNFCRDKALNLMVVFDHYNSIAILKIKNTENIISLHSLEVWWDDNGRYRINSITNHSRPRSLYGYAGFYHIPSDTLYDLQYASTSRVDLESHTINDLDWIKAGMNGALSAAITQYAIDAKLIDKDFDDARKEGSNESYIKRKAEEFFFEKMAPEDMTFTYYCTLPVVDDESIDLFLTNEEEWVKEEKEKFLSCSQNNSILQGDIDNFIRIKRELQKICEDKEGIYHLALKIKEAVGNAKNVHVTILKAGTEMTFTMGCEYFTNPWRGSFGVYAGFYLCGNDRKKYEEKFGYEDFSIRDITKITYGKKTLYEKAN